MGCRPLHYQSWIGIFGNNICTYFIRSAKLANYCQPRTFYGKSLCASVISAIAVGSRTSAKESIWDVAWLSNTSGSGWRTGSTRVSRRLSPNPPNRLLLLITHFTYSGFAGKLSVGNAYLIPTSYLCWEFMSPRIPRIYVSSLTGCKGVT